jgi:hypothetical protein
MEEMLESGGSVNFNPRGTSMLPTLRNDGDRVVIVKPKEMLKKYDLPLYIRQDGSFVLHRVVRKPQNGIYTMCGDNQWVLEKGVKHEQIVGVVVSLCRNGKEISTDNKLYKIYVRLWVAIMPIRHIVIGGLRRIKRIIKGK